MKSTLRALLLTTPVLLSACQVLPTAPDEAHQDADPVPPAAVPGCAPPTLQGPPHRPLCTSADWLSFSADNAMSSLPSSPLHWWPGVTEPISLQIALGVHYSHPDTPLILRQLGQSFLQTALQHDLPVDVRQLLDSTRAQNQQVLTLQHQLNALQRSHQAILLEQQNLHEQLAEKQRQIDALADLEAQLSNENRTGNEADPEKTEASDD